MSNLDAVLIMPGNAATSGVPFVTKPDDLDAWPLVAATQMAMNTLAALIRQFSGVRFESAGLVDGRMVGNFLFDSSTPEGCVGGNVLRLAREGVCVTEAAALDAITRLYREQGLPLPTNKNAR